jgi:hypothetical protein
VHESTLPDAELAAALVGTDAVATLVGAVPPVVGVAVDEPHAASSVTTAADITAAPAHRRTPQSDLMTSPRQPDVGRDPPLD